MNGFPNRPSGQAPAGQSDADIEAKMKEEAAMRAMMVVVLLLALFHNQLLTVSRMILASRVLRTCPWTAKRPIVTAVPVLTTETVLTMLEATPICASHSFRPHRSGVPLLAAMEAGEWMKCGSVRCSLLA